MAKKRRYPKVGLYAQHAPDIFNTENPGWRQQAKQLGDQLDENDLHYQVFDGENDKTSLINLEIRRGISSAVVLATLRKLVDLIDRHPEYLAGGPTFVTGGLTVNDDGSLGPVIPEDDEAEQGDESTSLSVVG